MEIAATYICPVRGLAGLEPPDTGVLGKTAGIAKDLRLDRLLLPVLDECLLGSTRAKVHFLDGLIQALDRVSEAGLGVWLMAPAGRILGLSWAPPYLVGAARDPSSGPVFVDGKVRYLKPFEWWADPSLVQKRIRHFREIVSAVNGHPAITGWLILDRFLEWSRPDAQAAEMILRSFTAEVRERDEEHLVYLGTGWTELLNPEMLQLLGDCVDGFRLSGLDSKPSHMRASTTPAGELLMAAYMGTLFRWLFDRPTETEIGWSLPEQADHMEAYIEAGRSLANQDLAGVVWVNLTDPEYALRHSAPWRLQPGLIQTGLLDQGLTPKEWVPSWIETVGTTSRKDDPYDFIDLDKPEFLADPYAHMPRLWDHFQDTL